MKYVGYDNWREYNFDKAVEELEKIKEVKKVSEKIEKKY